MRQIPVELGEGSYRIDIAAGLLCDASWWASQVAGRQVAIVTDTRVARHYLEPLAKVVGQAADGIVKIVLEAGEHNKDWKTLDEIFDGLLAARCDRNTILIALGGGVIGDIAGFAAASFMRGIEFIQVPTTLLAQVDSSIGGKTGINHARGKNMVGAFYQPRAVLIDPATLASLPPREVAAGAAEVIKHAAIASRPHFEWLEVRIEALMALEAETVAQAIEESCRIKAGVVAADEREGGVRALLNFGHTFGHAIEAGLGYGTWLHGEAVAAGMVQAAELSVLCGRLARSDAQRLTELIGRARLPVRAPDLGWQRWQDLMAVDKKSLRGAPRFVLLKGLGAASLEAVDAQLVKRAIDANIAETRTPVRGELLP